MARFTKKKLIAGTTAMFVLCAAGGAIAYWTVGGSGTGSAATGTAVNVSVVQTSTPTDLRPAGAPQSLNGTFTNTNNGPVFVGTVTAAIASVVTSPVSGDCEANDYTLANPVITFNAEVSDADNTTWTGPTIAFNNEVAENQNDCKGATVNFSYTIS